jgi:hypothetical protein
LPNLLNIAEKLKEAENKLSHNVYQLITGRTGNTKHDAEIEGIIDRERSGKPCSDQWDMLNEVLQDYQRSCVQLNRRYNELVQEKQLGQGQKKIAETFAAAYFSPDVSVRALVALGRIAGGYQKRRDTGAAVINTDEWSNRGSTERNSEKAFEFYKKAADLGDDEGQYYAGDCLYKGRGTAQNTAEGLKLYQKSAYQHNNQGEHALGNIMFQEYRNSYKNNPGDSGRWQNAYILSNMYQWLAYDVPFDDDGNPMQRRYKPADERRQSVLNELEKLHQTGTIDMIRDTLPAVNDPQAEQPKNRLRNTKR